MTQFLNNLKIKFTELRPNEAIKLAPCSEADVFDLESQLSTRLPLAYREYLLWAGRSVNFLGFRYHTYYALQNVKPYLREILSNIKPPPHLADDAFVFAFAFDESPLFYFFRLNQGDDPKVYIYIEPELKRYFQDAPRETWPPEWQFLYGTDEKDDFNEFAPSFTSFRNNEMDKHIQSKVRSEEWRASYKPTSED